MTVPHPPAQVTSFGTNYLRPCRVCRRQQSKYVKTNKGILQKNSDKRIVPDLLRLMCVIQKRLYFNSLWTKPCPRTCPSLRIERYLILQYPAPVCNLEYLPEFVLERKSMLHQMSAEKEHWAMADQSEWVVLKELNNGFQQC